MVLGASGSRDQAEESTLNLPDSQAAPVRPIILADVNAVDAIVLIPGVDVWYAQMFYAQTGED